MKSSLAPLPAPFAPALLEPETRPLYCVPPAEQAEFATFVPLKTERDRINLMLATLEEIGPNPRHGTLVAACRRLARENGFTRSEVYESWRRYHPVGDWRAVADGRRTRGVGDEEHNVRLPQDFLDYWRTKPLKNQRVSKASWRALIREWLAWRNGSGRKIPGYEVCPPVGPTGRHPLGWSYRNLMQYAPSEYEIVLARRGPAAAAELLPPVLTTRVGLHPGSIYILDDLWRDFLVSVYGETGARRLLQISCVDFFAASNIARGYKAVRLNERGTEERLKECETLWLLASVLIGIGYHRDGVLLLLERGTATVRDGILQLLAKWSGAKWDGEKWAGGLITYRKPGVFGRPPIKGLYQGQSRGNPRHKARIESAHNYYHNEAADIETFPGQTGRRYDLAPEELYGRKAYHEELLKRAEGLAPEVRARLATGFLDAFQAMRLLDDMHARVDARTEHELEGWREAGLFCGQWRLATDALWRDEDELMAIAATDPAQFHDITQAINADRDRLTTTRRLSPREVFRRGEKDLVRLPPECAIALLADCYEQFGRVEKYQLHAPATGHYGEDQIFEGWVFDPEGKRRTLENGQRYRLYPNFQDHALIFVCTEGGELVGQAQRWNVPTPNNEEALARIAGKVTSLAKDLRPNYDRAFGPLAEKNAAEKAWNDALIKGEATPAQADTREGNRLPPKPDNAAARKARMKRFERMANAGATAAEHEARAKAELTALIPPTPDTTNQGCTDETSA